MDAAAAVLFLVSRDLFELGHLLVLQSFADPIDHWLTNDFQLLDLEGFLEDVLKDFLGNP